MLRNRIYYQIKPLIPWRVRLAVRRWLATRKRAQVSGIWPILPGSERPPEGWPGWPEGKRFALVLTHDVEGVTGLAKCRQLMELEKEQGFRSSFNFVPEGGYSLAPELREQLRRDGFEVGIHDLHHDGKLYRSRREFQRNALRINEYLKDWGAVGFRAGFMLHNLDWLHELNIQYDASTFDTDPFEPQPDSQKTIFPFWVTPPVEPGCSGQTERANSGGIGKHRGGYVELPYTLPQDSTLFLLLGERHPDIWFQKLDWLARRGGMVLVNAHPDYMEFDTRVSPGKYSVEKYKAFLTYISNHYQGQYWHATPAELAAWYRKTVVDRPPAGTGLSSRENGHFRADQVRKGKRLAGKRAAVVVYSYFPADARPKRETEALAAEGMEVEVFCLRDGDAELPRETRDGITITRLPLRRRRSTKVAYISQYLTFGLLCCSRLFLRSLFRRYDFVHVHNMPDLLVFTALGPRLRGAKLLLDLHDPMPELAVTIYQLPEQHKMVRWLKLCERWSIAFADLAITPNLAFKQLFCARSCGPEKMEIVMNTPQAEVFAPERYQNGSSVQRDPNASFTIMYHGLIAERHGLDTAIQAAAHLRTRIPKLRFLIYGGRTEHLAEIESLVRKLQLDDIVQYEGQKSLVEIAQAIFASDLGIIPNRRTSFTEVNMPTRIFENLAMEKPVIVPRTRGIQDYFTEDQILFFEPGDAVDLANRIEWVYEHPVAAKEFVAKGRCVYAEHLWKREGERFIQIVEKLLKGDQAPNPALDAKKPDPSPVEYRG